MKKRALIFTGMNVEKYGAVERNFTELARQLYTNHFESIFVFNTESSSVKKYEDDLKDYKVNCLVLNPKVPLFKLIISIYQLIKTHQPHIVHTHFNPKIVRLVCYVSFFMRVPKRYNTFHGMAQSKKLITKIWMYSLNLLNTKQFAISNAIKNEQITVFKTSKNKIETLRLGLHKSRFNITESKETIKKKYNLPSQGLLIGCVAFHNPIKGIDVLLEAFALLKTQTKQNVYICQIGSYTDDYTAYLKQKAKNLDIADKVIWLGVQNQVPELLSTFDVYVQPSRSEGLGLAILEAFYFKLPVVGANVGGIPEIVNNNNGFLFKSENPKHLAAQLLKLIESETLRTKKGNFGYAFVTSNYNQEQQVKRLITHYKN